MTKKTIKLIKAREILDSRGKPTVEAKIFLSDGSFAKASVPSGASTGSHEAVELRDGGKRYLGQGVLKACRNIETLIFKSIKGRPVDNLQKIDEIMINLDGTEDRARLGANSILAVSMAAARAGSVAYKQPLYLYLQKVYGFMESKIALPVPLMNFFNGGVHASTNLAIQEMLVIPVKPSKFKEKVRAGSEIFYCLKQILSENKMDTDVGDEGGFAPDFKNTENAFELLAKAVAKAEYLLGNQIRIGIDAASNGFFDKSQGKYTIKSDKFEGDSGELIKKYSRWRLKYHLWSIEDGLAEDDWVGWANMTQELGANALLIGDDLFVTQVKRLKKGIESKVANAILVKLNQVGSLTETVEVVKLAKENGYKCVVSHRSGDTDDSFVADFAVACGAEFIKTGSVTRMERVVKYNRLMDIEEEIYG